MTFRRSEPPCRRWAADRSACTTVWRRNCTQQALTTRQMCCQHAWRDGAACRLHTDCTYAVLWCLPQDYNRWRTVEVPILILEGRRRWGSRLVTGGDPAWQTATGCSGKIGSRIVPFLSPRTLCRRLSGVSWLTVSNAVDKSRPTRIVTFFVISGCVNTV